MATAQADIKSQTMELSKGSFETFCEDISGMFGVSMKCTQQQICTDTIEGLKEHFQELTAVTLVKAKGTLNGTFQLIFDQPGLFILGNLMVMPERMASFIEKYAGSQKIAKNIQSGTLKDAEEISDAVGEVCNLMVGSWDRAFREGLDNHEHFKQIRTFIGNPFEKPEEDVELLPDEELQFVLYEMTASSYPAFTCGAIFPKAVFNDAETEAKIRAEARAKVLAEAGEKAKAETVEKPSEAETEARIEAEERAKVEAEMKAKLEAEEKAGTEDEEKATIKAEETAKAETGEKPDEADTKARIEAEERAKVEAEMKAGLEAEEKAGTEAEEKATVKAEETAKAETGEKSDEADTKARTEAEERAKVETEIKARLEAEEKAGTEAEEKINAETEEKSGIEAEEKTDITGNIDENKESTAGGVSETIQKMAKLPEDLHEGLTHISSSMCAKDIMEKEVVWGSPDDSVEQILAKMQQADVSYVMIGKDGVLEGIVSKSNMAEAISPYLRPAFAKWRRPLDDATLHIKVKWMMSRSVRTIKPETPFMVIIENMSRFGGRCLPIVDRGGKVQGLVTVFDVFKVLLNTNPDISTVGKTIQAPPLLQLNS